MDLHSCSHGLIRRFAIDGTRNNITFTSRFVRTRAFEIEKKRLEIEKGRGALPALGKGSMPLLLRGIGTNVEIFGTSMHNVE